MGTIAFDNHLEGSSGERYSQVVEPMHNLPAQEEPALPLYGGMARHANHTMVVVRHEQAQGLSHRRLAHHLPTLLVACAPYQVARTGVVGESTSPWD
jgi:hypothetical protein